MGTLSLTELNCYYICRIFTLQIQVFYILVRLERKSTGLCLKTTNEFYIMANIITNMYIQRILSLAKLLIVFVVLIDPENVSFVILFVRFGHRFTELCFKN